MKRILVLPAYNESSQIVPVIERARQYVEVVLVVNDGSRDDTAARAADAGALVLSHRINLGKAAALKTGCEAALKLGADVIVLMDSDGQHRAEDIPRVLEPILKGEVDVVVASRSGGGKMPLIRHLGNRALEAAIRLLFRVNIKDIQSGFRSFRSSVYPKLAWRAKDYHADAEMTARIGRFSLRYKEIYIETIYHDSYKGMTVVDGIKLLGNIFLWRFTL